MAQQQEGGAHHDLLQRFPPINWGFAYGSGVFKQPDLYVPGTPARDGPMLDLVFVVDDPLTWHAENLRLNRQHYSLVAGLGPRAVCAVAKRVGVGVYFNTLVPFGQQYIKYGVIGLQPFLEDLSCWTHFYLAGRLHKPVRALQAPRGEAVQRGVQQNLRGVVHAALLLSPERFSLRDLFKRITSLSYTGDVRMGLAEDSRKVERIVAGSYGHFVDMYQPLLQDSSSAVGVQPDRDEHWRQDTSPDNRLRLLSRLPVALLQELGRRCGVISTSAALTGGTSTGSTAPSSSSSSSSSSGGSKDADCYSSGSSTGTGSSFIGGSTDSAASDTSSSPSSKSFSFKDIAQHDREAIAAAALRTGRYQQHLIAGLHSVVGRSSRRQAVAGFLSAGLVKSVRYVARKVAKAWRTG